MPSTSSKPPKDESALKKQIVDWLRSVGVFCWRAGAGPYQQAGVPDIAGCLPSGLFLHVEAKMPGKQLTPIQEKRVRQVRAYSPNAIIIAPAYSLEEVRAVVEPLVGDAAQEVVAESL